MRNYGGLERENVCSRNDLFQSSPFSFSNWRRNRGHFLAKHVLRKIANNLDCKRIQANPMLYYVCLKQVTNASHQCTADKRIWVAKNRGQDALVKSTSHVSECDVLFINQAPRQEPPLLITLYFLIVYFLIAFW